MKTGRIVAIVAVLAVAGGGAWWWPAGTQQALVAKTLPAMPDMSAAPAVLGERVGEAEARARSRTTAARGLAELSRLYHANGFLAEAQGCYAGLEQLAPGEPRWAHLHALILAGF